MRLRPILIAGALLLARAASADEFDLAAFLKRTAVYEVERASTTCRWTEKSRLEELDGKGQVKGAIVRTFSVTSRGPETLSRTKTSETIEGDVSSLMRQERPPPKGDPKQRLSPFHPEASPFFNISLSSRDERAVIVAFSPKEAADGRMTGTAKIDPATGRVMEMSISPSRLMPMLDRLAMKVHFEPGPCGNLPQAIESEGSGGFLFFKIRFHGRTELSGYEKVTAR